MSHYLWAHIDGLFVDALHHDDPVLDAVLEESAAAGLPPINVAPNQGKLLHLLALACGARHILEVGTLGGYSTIWLARALPPDGMLISLEIDPKHAFVARENVARAGLAERVQVRIGAALDLMPRLTTEALPPFDFVFIDADKEHNADYFDWAMTITRPGSLIVIDNVVRDGAIIDGDSADTRVQGVQRLIRRLSAESRVTATALQTVGSKGYDGFVLARVNG
jgi:predicted O-methyltransferase YrrM